MMENYTKETYGERIAEIYDQWYSEFDPAAVATLAELAGSGEALELGIGTGRIALPLANMGVSVAGIDASEAMVSKLRRKVGGDKIAVTMGNFADVAVSGKFSLIYVVFNTLYSLLTQEDQIRCFQNVADHLTPDGVFAIEAFVPDMTRFTAGQAMRLIRIEEKAVQMDVSEHDRGRQLITSQHVLLTEKGTQFYPVQIRYIWPSEMDLMARVSGLQLRERWSDWNKSEFDGESGKHISVYSLVK
jgi:SAM-dependent methyltransferase